MEQKKSQLKEVLEFKNLFKDKVITLVISAFGLCAALFWNDAISSIIKELLPEGNTWPYKLFSAIFVTFIAVFAIYFVTKLFGEKKK